MSQFTKHVDEKEDYAFDFTDVLSDEENLSSGTENVKVLDWDFENETWDEVTSEFGSLDIGIDGKEVQFTLNAQSSDGEQEDDPYLVYCKVETSNSRVLVGTEELIIDTTGA